MRVAYVTTYDPLNTQSWSGSIYYIAQALKNQSISLEYIGSLKEKCSLLFKGKQCLYNYIFKNLPSKKYLRDREPFIVKNYAHQVSHRLSQINYDLVLSPGTIPIAYLDCNQPIVFWTDSTFSGMLDFYPEFTNLSKKTIINGNALESSALSRCKLAIYSSDWAAQTAIQNYGVEPSKVKVVPFGANLECRRNLDDIKTIVNSRSQKKCKLLFLGIDWYRKGGTIALEIVKNLNKMGLYTELKVVGCRPLIDESLHKFVKILGFISKSNQAGLIQINKLLAETHFLILPSRAETYGVVLCEANSFGVPCLSTNVGGIPTVVKDGLNGKTFSPKASVVEYCTYISNLWSDYSHYKNLALSSFNEYRSRLNWSVAGQTVRNLLSELM